MREQIEKLLAAMNQTLPVIKPSDLRTICEALLALDERLTKLEDADDKD